MKKQIFKEFITVKKVRYLPLPEPPPPPPPPPVRRVLVVGLYTLHMISVCDEHPSPGELVHSEEGMWRLGGNGPDLCSVLRRLGSETTFLGLLSKHPAFEYLTLRFHSKNIDIASCPLTALKPSHKCIVLVPGKNTQTTITNTTRKHELSYQQFLGGCDFRKYSWIHFESRNYTQTVRMMQAVRDYNARSPDRDITISVDLHNMRPSSLYLGYLADYVCVSKNVMNTYAYMNGRETVWAVREGIQAVYKVWLSKQPKKTPDSNIIETEEDVEAKLNTCEVPKKREPTIIFAKYEEGASCLTPDNTYFKVGPHKPQKIVGTIGEHEAFVGGFIYAFQDAKLSLRDAVEYATRASVIKITGYGFDTLRCMPKTLRDCYYT